MAEIVLTEWQASLITLSASDVRYLMELGERNGSPILMVAPKGDNIYLASASHYIGLLRLPSGHTLEIRPKVPIGNIVAMLNTVNDLGAFLPTLTGTTTFTGLLDILIEQFMVALDKILAHGLLQGFATQQEQSITIRGKLNISQTLRRAPSIRHHSESPDATIDIVENQVLRFTCDHLLERLPLSTTQARYFQTSVRRFQGISSEGISRDTIRGVQFSRLNEHYRPALALAELLLFDQSPASAGYQRQQPSYLVDMNQLFERYTTTVLRRASEDKYQVTIQAGYDLDQDSQLSIRPDVVLQPHQRLPVPVDMKYKVRLYNEDVYQALAYCQALYTDRAVLVYTGDVHPQRFVMDGRNGMKIVIVVLALDLSGDVTIMLNSATKLVEAVHRVVGEVPDHT